MSDLIDRQAAIDILDDFSNDVLQIWHGSYGDARKKMCELPSVQSEPQWIPCSERLPEEDYWLGGSGKQFSEQVLVTIANHDDDDNWVDISHTIDGEWALELPRHCEITAWMPLPESYNGGGQNGSD